MATIRIEAVEINLNDLIRELTNDHDALELVATAILPHLLRNPVFIRAVAHGLLQDGRWLNALYDQVADKLIQDHAITYGEVEITEHDRTHYYDWYGRHFGFDRNMARRLARSGMTLEEVLTLDEEAMSEYYGISREMAQRIVRSRPPVRRVRTFYQAPFIPEEEKVPEQFDQSYAGRWYRYWWKLSTMTASVLANKGYTPDQLMGSFEELIMLSDIGASRAAEIIRRRRKV